MTAELISRTGRVQSWLDNPESRLPVSCTVFVVEDSMEGKNGIEASWRFVSHALRHGAGVAVHLSKLRARGSENGKGLTASGPVSFAKIYSTLNETLRRGGVYKNGAVVAHIDIDHADILEFVRTPRSELPWIKRCVNLDREKWEAATGEVKAAILYGIKSGDIWLTKIAYDNDYNRIYGNVCLEVRLRTRATCLLEHVNLGACNVEDIATAYFNGMSELCSLHGKTGVDKSGEYLSPTIDKQVGLGVLGLANLLRRYKVTYAQFGEALEQVNRGDVSHTPAWILADNIRHGLQMATQVAHSHQMVRAFAIAPTASCSYRSKDLDGYTCAPEIAPPIERTVDRDSGTFGVQTYDYGNVEIASEVGWDTYKKVADEFIRLYQNTGLLHGYSFNSWSDAVEYNEQFVEEWLDSPQTSLYYALQVMGNTQDKTDVYAALEQNEVDDYLQELLNDPVTCDCQE